MKARSTAYGVLLLGGVLGLVASAQPWWRAVGDEVSVKFSGTQASAGLSQALVVIGLAGALLVLALRARGRQVVGGLVVLVGAGAVVVGVLRLRPSADAVRTQVREVSLADQFAVVPTAWPWVYAGAGLLLATGGLLVALTARRWPVRADRFARAGEAVVVTAASDPTDVWRAMDAGLDPTADTDPDVHSISTKDTMGVSEEGSSKSSDSGDSTPTAPSVPGQELHQRRE